MTRESLMLFVQVDDTGRQEGVFLLASCRDGGHFAAMCRLWECLLIGEDINKLLRTLSLVFDDKRKLDAIFARQVGDIWRQEHVHVFWRTSCRDRGQFVAVCRLWLLKTETSLLRTLWGVCDDMRSWYEKVWCFFVCVYAFLGDMSVIMKDRNTSFDELLVVTKDSLQLSVDC